MSVERRTIGSTVTVVAVQDAEGYNVNVSPSIITFHEDGSFTPDKITVSATIKTADQDVQPYVGYWKMTRNGYEPSLFQSNPASSIEISSSAIPYLKDYFPLTFGVYEKKTDTVPLATNSVSRIDEPAPKSAATLLFRPGTQYYDADNGGAAIRGGSYTVYCTMCVDGNTFSPTSIDSATLEGTTTEGAIIRGPFGNNHFGLSIEQGKSPSCQIKVTATGTYEGVSYTAVGVTSIAALRMGPQGGSVGTLGKMYYYDGVYDSSRTYSLTETQAPYVRYGEEFFMLDNAANQGAGIDVTGVTPTDGGDPWTKMASEMKYYIAEAMFADFAELGSSIFNEDFQFSQHGVLRGYGDMEYKVNNSLASWYKYADANNMMGEIDTLLVNETSSKTVSNTSYNTSNRVRMGYFSNSRTSDTAYLLKLNTTVTGKKLTVAVAQNVSSGTLQNKIIERTITTGNSGTIYIPCVIPVRDSGYFYLYWKCEDSGTNPVINSIMGSEAAYRPNVFIDFLQGFLFANKGYFKDVTVEGRINNLITVIDWDNNVGRDKIIEAYVNAQGNWDINNPYVSHGEYINIAYYLDMLNCGDFIYVKSLPAYGSAGGSNYVYYRMPYYATDFLQDRGHTRDTEGTPHKMTPDELRKLIRRSITLKIETSGDNLNTTYITGLLRLTPPNFYSLEYLEHGRKYFITPQQSGESQYYQKEDLKCFNQVIHFQFDQVVWFAPTAVDNPTASEGYGYVWTGQLSLPSNGTIDNFNWT